MAAGRIELGFHEALLLIALRDETGTLHPQADMCSHVLAAGILAELLLAGRIALADDRKKLVDVVDDTPLGDELVDECLYRVRDAKRRRRLEHWVSVIANQARLLRRVAGGLCVKGVLREDEGRILWIFRRRIYPEVDARHEQRIIERLRKAILSETPRVDPRVAVLVSLLHGAGMLTIPLDKRTLRERKQRIQQICDGQVIGRAAREAVEAAQAAVIAATVAATAAVTAATS